jgi:hypothetical protein
MILLNVPSLTPKRLPIHRGFSKATPVHVTIPGRRATASTAIPIHGTEQGNAVRFGRCNRARPAGLQVERAADGRLGERTARNERADRGRADGRLGEWKDGSTSGRHAASRRIARRADGTQQTDRQAATRWTAQRAERWLDKQKARSKRADRQRADRRLAERKDSSTSGQRAAGGQTGGERMGGSASGRTAR